ncbi:hypothetical protein [Streptomyces chumphonensis]|uniref:hypothetical protein n=1 Tax=Streptomyces chumphonensis TaxID=1214925 RepID=UPI003D7501B3
MTQPHITPDAAAHVLHHTGHGGYPPSPFHTHLIRALDAADTANFTALYRAFPTYGEAMATYMHDPDGVARLQQIATGSAS